MQLIILGNEKFHLGAEKKKKIGLNIRMRCIYNELREIFV